MTTSSLNLKTLMSDVHTTTKFVYKTRNVAYRSSIPFFRNLGFLWV